MISCVACAGGAGQKNDPITQKNKDVSHACLVFKFKLSGEFSENLTRRRDAVDGRGVVDGTDDIGGSAFLQPVFSWAGKDGKRAPAKKSRRGQPERYELATAHLF
jgi:hypothetical protein